jgi:hypothetical protein
MFLIFTGVMAKIHKLFKHSPVFAKSQWLKTLGVDGAGEAPNQENGHDTFQSTACR